ncbi:MAG: hypothetical protein M1462_04835 [Candidatus Thermoplasmatota archaeon]|jgi:hypothetical protein|uniref:hypothetical protein n=1 Tax=Ferroplasma sp. TaxID=2591003 RepID=UPI00263194C1|nr:hypothetical protein [Ferroplasma sp.]MCL4311736.1 hypothetical protein [Candidatus Thermoplasmatota archaeon]
MDNVNNEKSENIKAGKTASTLKYDDVDMEIGDDDLEYKEVGIWKNPYAVAIIIIAIWFSLWLFLQVFMGRWFS